MYTQVNEKIFDHFPILESDRLIFRAYKKEDANTILLLKTDERVMKYMDSDRYKSVAEAINSIKSYENDFSNKQAINWAIVEKSSNKTIGYFCFWRLDKKNCRGEIGYSLLPDAWGKGYMLESAKALINFGFNDLHLHSIEANINPNNESSRKLLVKLGFKKEAHFKENHLFNGRYTDSAIYSLLEGNTSD